MHIYYRGPDAIVTESHFVWRAETTRAFVITELRKVRLVQSDIRRPWIIPAMFSTILAAAVALPAWMLLDNPAGRAGVAAVALSAVILVTLKRRKVRRWELRAAYHEREVTIYSTLDITTFNQVTRALRRAVEGADSARQHQRMAAA